MKVEIKGDCLKGGYSRLEISRSNRFMLFIYEDSNPATNIPLHIDNLTVENHLVAIGQHPSVNIVEHLFSALYGLSLFDVRIEVFGDEIPFFDGSSLRFVESLQKIKIRDCLPSTFAEVLGRNDKNSYFFDGLCKVLRLDKTIELREGESFIRYEPLKQDRLIIEMELSHPYIGTQRITLEINRENYKREIAPARTFVFTTEDDPRLKNLPPYGFGITENGIYSREPLRYPDEPVRHKVLDLLGDFYVLQKKVFGKIMCRNTSHLLNLKFVTEMLINVR